MLLPCVCVCDSPNIRDTVSVSKRHDTTQRAFLPPLTCLPAVTDYVQGQTALRSTNVTLLTILSWDLHILAISVYSKARRHCSIFLYVSNVSDSFQTRDTCGPLWNLNAHHGYDERATSRIKDLCKNIANNLL